MAYPLGTFLPLLVIVGGLGYCFWRKKRNELFKFYTLLIVGMVSVFTQATYKAFTGRVSPTCNQYSDAFEVSYSCLQDTAFALNSFNFGWLESGVFFGWPSGHSITAVAVGLLFSLVFWGNTKLRYLGFIFVIYVPVGVSFRGHWLSDILAGALVGATIALAAYTYYSNRLNQSKQTT